MLEFSLSLYLAFLLAQTLSSNNLSLVTLEWRASILMSHWLAISDCGCLHYTSTVDLAFGRGGLSPLGHQKPPLVASVAVITQFCWVKIPFSHHGFLSICLSHEDQAIGKHTRTKRCFRWLWLWMDAFEACVMVNLVLSSDISILWCNMAMDGYHGRQWWWWFAMAIHPTSMLSQHSLPLPLSPTILSPSKYLSTTHHCHWPL